MAALLAVLSLAGCSRSLADLFGQNPGEDVPPPIEAGGTFTVTYKAGNGTGDTVTQLVSKGMVIQPGGSADFSATGSNMSFAGWNDGTFTYAANDPYLITDNVTFQARWGFTSIEGVNAYLEQQAADTASGSVLLVVCDGADIALVTLGSSITSKIAGKTVELDLSASTLGVVNGELNLSAFSGVSANKLILPRAATSTTDSKTFSGTAPEVSGLNVASIGTYAFNGCTLLDTANFPLATDIGKYAFYNCALETANFPKAAKIGESAFKDSTKLKTAQFPVATTIGFNAFEGCMLLETITIDAGCDVRQVSTDSRNDAPEDGISKGFREVYTGAGTYTRNTATGAWTGPAS
jgi:hypothetical protein